ncbi:MAG: PAS domain S-box protein [Bacteroidota bacterium]|nr:PAS domain S-box protein [Bacteroidota bacterium]
MISKKITSEKEYIRKSNDWYRSLFENSAEAIFLTDTQGHILAANPEACKMFQRTEEDICKIGRNGIININDPRLEPTVYPHLSLFL